MKPKIQEVPKQPEDPQPKEFTFDGESWTVMEGQKPFLWAPEGELKELYVSCINLNGRKLAFPLSMLAEKSVKITVE